MMRRCRKSFTGSRASLRPAIFLALLLQAAPATASAQTLGVRSLELPVGIRPGGWSSYQVRAQSQNHPARVFTQRVAVVGGEGIGSDAGVWAEVKSVEAGGSVRIERGFFTPPRSGEEPSKLPTGEAALVVSRYQVLNPDGHLYEFSLDADVLAGASPELSALALYQVDGRVPLDRQTIGPDTLRVGGRAYPTTMERIRWIGSEEWPDPADTLAVYRALLTQTIWRAPKVPVTGYVRSIFEVSTQRFGPRDSTGALTPLPPKAGSEPKTLYSLEMNLIDLGNDAVPEVTQEAEPAPAEMESPEEHGIPSR